MVWAASASAISDAFTGVAGGLGTWEFGSLTPPTLTALAPNCGISTPGVTCQDKQSGSRQVAPAIMYNSTAADITVLSGTTAQSTGLIYTNEQNAIDSTGFALKPKTVTFLPGKNAVGAHWSIDTPGDYVVDGEWFNEEGPTTELDLLEIYVGTANGTPLSTVVNHLLNESDLTFHNTVTLAAGQSLWFKVSADSTFQNYIASGHTPGPLKDVSQQAVGSPAGLSVNISLAPPPPPSDPNPPVESAVPEPGSFVLLAAGAGAFAFLRRRKAA